MDILTIDFCFIVQGAEIDLRLYSTEVMMKAEPALDR